MSYQNINGVNFSNINNITGLLNSNGEILTGDNGKLKIISPPKNNGDLLLVYNSEGLNYSGNLNGSRIATIDDIQPLINKIEKLERIIDLLSNSIKSVNI